MKKYNLLLYVLATLTMVACNTNPSDSSVASVDTQTTVTKFDPDISDSIPGDAYPEYNSDTGIAVIIRKSMQEAEKDNLPTIPVEDRMFKYHAFDLNNDGKNEYAVALYRPFFCGSGGCTAYILHNDGTVLTRFTVVRFPIYVAATLNDGWRDLIVYSGGQNRLAKHKGGKYPSNPSTEEVVKGDIPKVAPALLNIWDSVSYPAFDF